MTIAECSKHNTFLQPDPIDGIAACHACDYEYRKANGIKTYSEQFWDEHQAQRKTYDEAYRKAPLWKRWFMASKQ